MHSGPSAQHGHYYTYCKASSIVVASTGTATSFFLIQNPPANDEEESWFLCNDSHVTRASFRQISAVTQSFHYDVPYILFFVASGDTPTFGTGSFNVKKTANNSDDIPSILSREVVTDNIKFLKEQEDESSGRSSTLFSAQGGGWWDDKGSGNDGQI